MKKDYTNSSTGYYYQPIQVELYPDQFDGYEMFYTPEKVIDSGAFVLYQSTIIHEVGHAFGLADLYEYNDKEQYTRNQVKFSIMHSSAKSEK